MRADRKVNLADITQRAILLEEITQSRGWHNISISPARPKATSPQHRYYRGEVLPLAKMWLNETQGAEFDEDEAHWWLKTTLRGVPIVNPATGEQIGLTARSHAEYDVAEMIGFIDEVIELLRRCDVNVPQPKED